jgi:hypothetical protein
MVPADWGWGWGRSNEINYFGARCGILFATFDTNSIAGDTRYHNLGEDQRNMLW